MPKKKSKKNSNSSTSSTTTTNGDPLRTATSDLEFLSVASSLLQHNDASFDTLRTEVNQLRQQHLVQKEMHATDIDQLVKSHSHLQHLLNISEQTLISTQEEVVRVTTEAEHVQRTMQQDQETSQQKHAAQVRRLQDDLEDITSEYQLLTEFQQKKIQHDALITRMETDYETMKRKYEERLRLKDVSVPYHPVLFLCLLSKHLSDLYCFLPVDDDSFLLCFFFFSFFLLLLFFFSERLSFKQKQNI